MDRKVSVIIVSALLAVGIIAFMLLRVWGDLLAAIAHWNPIFLVPAIGFSTAGWWLRGARYRSILRRLGIRAGLAFSTACVLISQTANLIIPARLGDLVRIFILKHEDLAGYPTGISSIVVERFFDILTVALLGLLALPFILGVPPWVYYIIVLPIAICGGFVLFLLLLGRLQVFYRGITRTRAILLTLVVAGLVILYSIYLASMSILEILLPLLFIVGISLVIGFVLGRSPGARRILARMNALILGMLGEVKGASLSIGSALGLSGISLVIWATDILTTVSVALMFRAEVNLAVIVLAVVVGNLFKAIPVTPGGIGTYEAAVAVILVLSGTTSQATATLIAISDHLVKNIITAVGGILSIWLLGGWVVDAIRDAFSGKEEAGP